MRKKILLTGATGYLGSHLAHRLRPEFDLCLLKRRTSNTFRIDSVLDQVTCVNIENGIPESLFREQKIFGIIHCATNYGRDSDDLNDTIDANLILPLRLLKIAIDYEVEFFINTDTVLDKRINYYSLSKSQFKDWFLFFSDRIKSINVELEHFYGEGDDPSKFVSKIINDLVSNESKDLLLTLGEQKRSFIYINDVVDAFQRILSNVPSFPKAYLSYQVGSSTHISIRDFVTLTKKLCGNTQTQLIFGALPYRKNEVMEVNIDLNPLKKLGWSDRVSLQEGLVRTIQHEAESFKRKIEGF